MTSQKIGTIIDKIFALDKKADALKAAHKKELGKIESQIKKLEDKAFKDFGKESLEGAAGKIAKASIDRVTVPNITSWNKLHAYIKKTGEFDLLQRRVSTTAYRARLEDKKRIPGIMPFVVVKLKVSKR